MRNIFKSCLVLLLCFAILLMPAYAESVTDFSIVQTEGGIKVIGNCDVKNIPVSIVVISSEDANVNLDENDNNIIFMDNVISGDEGVYEFYIPLLDSVDNLIARINAPGSIGRIQKNIKLPDDDTQNTTFSAFVETNDVGDFIENYNSSLMLNLDVLDSLENPDKVFWIEKGKFINYYQTPLDMSTLLHKGIFEAFSTVVCTSATLGIASNFSFWMRRTGILFEDKDRILQGIFDSPFPYKKNTIF